MARIRLLHWKKTEAQPYLDALRAARHKVEYDEKFGPALMRSWRTSPPDAFVIDLRRLPSHGREIAAALRQYPATRLIPVVFCGGQEEKVARVRSELPDASYCTFDRLIPVLDRAMKKPPESVVVPKAMMERYAARTTAQKLGIVGCCSVAVIDPPRDYSQVLGPLPDGVEVVENERDGAAKVVLCFVYDIAELKLKIQDARRHAATSKLWLLWRKGRSAAGGITGDHIREAALGAGLVDYKICSVNPVWSGMLFAARH